METSLHKEMQEANSKLETSLRKDMMENTSSLRHDIQEANFSNKGQFLFIKLMLSAVLGMMVAILVKDFF